MFSSGSVRGSSPKVGAPGESSTGEAKNRAAIATRTTPSETSRRRALRSASGGSSLKRSSRIEMQVAAASVLQLPSSRPSLGVTTLSASPTAGVRNTSEAPSPVRNPHRAPRPRGRGRRSSGRALYAAASSRTAAMERKRTLTIWGVYRRFGEPKTSSIRLRTSACWDVAGRRAGVRSARRRISEAIISASCSSWSL